MAKKSTLKVEIDSALKTKAEKIMDRLGISPEEAVALFYEEIKTRNAMPFGKAKLAAPLSKLDASWQGWVDENLARGCQPAEICGILLSKKFSLQAIKLAMGEHFPGDPLEISASEIDYEALAGKPAAALLKRPDVKRFETPLVQLFRVENFMTEQECDKLAGIINLKLRPSTITVPSEDKYFRTSTTCDLYEMSDPFIELIDKRICAALGINRSYSEKIQAQKYTVGQQFKAHTDFFEPATEEYAKFASHEGNRTWTFMVYLNDTPKGGGTGFTKLKKVFYPKKGAALAWNNLCADGAPNRDTEHAGQPVEEGEKIIITKWFRENGSGKMLV